MSVYTDNLLNFGKAIKALKIIVSTNGSEPKKHRYRDEWTEAECFNLIKIHAFKLLQTIKKSNQYPYILCPYCGFQHFYHEFKEPLPSLLHRIRSGCENSDVLPPMLCAKCHCKFDLEVIPVYTFRTTKTDSDKTPFNE